MLSLREKYDRDGGSVAGVAQTINNLEKSRNIMGEDADNRFLWIDNLGLTSDERGELFREKSEIVYFLGCVGALFPQVGGIPQSLVKLLRLAKTDFTLLKDEWCCGYPIMAGGKGPENIKEYAEHNIAAIEKSGAKTVIVSCPTCHSRFSRVYPSFQDIPFKVMHYTEYFESRFADQSPDTAKGPGKSTVVTYHDPCDLGRKLNITGAPRNMLKSLNGVTFSEMRFSGEEGKCCGGGGNLEMVNPELSLGIAAKRINEALETGAEYLLSSCQQCKRTLQNAARKGRVRIKVMDILEFLLQRFEENSAQEAPK
jgi:heterodisulfide reductase subunit D